MQDKFISLDPEHSESSARQARSAVFKQRTLEAQGGIVSVQVQSSMTLTAGYMSYLLYRSRGFRMLPLQASKAPTYSVIAFSALFAHILFKGYCMDRLGNAEYYNYLLANKSAILNGQKSFEQ